MIDVERLRSQLQRADLSQSELARRVGVSQSAIHKLVSGGAYGSKHLHRIARELGTSPAYLTGEVDDPDGVVEVQAGLTRTEQELIDHYRRLRPSESAALLHVARTMAEQASR